MYRALQSFQRSSVNMILGLSGLKGKKIIFKKCIFTSDGIVSDLIGAPQPLFVPRLLNIIFNALHLGCLGLHT